MVYQQHLDRGMLQLLLLLLAFLVVLPKQIKGSLQHPAQVCLLCLKLLLQTSKQSNHDETTHRSTGSKILRHVCVLDVTGRLGASELSPSRGLTDLASRMFNPSRQPEAGLPPKPPTSHYDIYRNLSDQACRNQETQLSLAEAPFHDAAKSGVASFAYFEPGFLTSPFR